MKIIADTNRIIAALIRDGTSRKILLTESIAFFAPDYSLTEIRNHSDEIKKKACIDQEEFEVLLSLIFENIKIMPEDGYKKFLTKAKILISDIDDVPFIAASLALKADGIWSNDKHFLEQKEIKIYTTEELIRLI